jgi:hypothetical protein|tara:strand:+ start:2181 stop:2387 length:207 start_codon:yes stop_codon:yes gene_type:complete
MKNIKIQETQYVRDTNSKAVLNTNRKALESYKLARQNKQREIDDINNMKRDIAELKEMIKNLLGKQNG